MGTKAAPFQEAAPNAKDLFGHPRGLATLFFTELWERFGFYGMRALLILFMTAPVENGGLGFPVAKAGAIYGLYAAMVYLSAVPGGWVADRILGQQKAVLYGGMIIAIGYSSLALPSLTVFYSGMVLVVIGTGLLKPNISTIVGQLYREGDPRRDGGFSIFYMGINIGAFAAPLICGYVGQRINWRWGFALSGIGMVIGLIQYWLGTKHLGGAGRAPQSADSSARRNLGLAVLAFVVVMGALWAMDIDAQQLVNAAGLLLLATVIGFFVWLFSTGGWTPVERKRLLAVALLFLAACMFWSAFEQAGSTLNLFANEHVDNQLAGFSIPASFYQSLNALFLVLFAPVFAWIWVSLRDRNPSSPVKFAWGLFLVGAGFAVIAVAALGAKSGTKVSPLWLVAMYLFHTWGELCLSPVGLSAITKLAPARVGGLMMGVWFMSISTGNYIGGRVASVYDAFPLEMIFGLVAAFAAGAGVILLLSTRPIVKMMGGVR